MLAAMSEAHPDIPDLPGYRVLRAIGSGAAATVYVAIKRSLAREVAAKVFRTTEAASIAAFEQVLRANARLSHPGIVGIHQIGRSADGRLYHSMPLLPGAAAARRRLRLRPLKVAAVVRELLDALAYAHQLDVIHGSITPANVLFDAAGRAKLADFGIARQAAVDGRPDPATSAYLSPEQLRGAAPDARSDLYSLAAVACELLTGTAPFPAGSDEALLATRTPPRLPPAASSWQAWIDQALAANPERRFQNAAAMAAALAALAGARPSRPGGATARPGMPAWTLALAVLVLAVVGAAAFWFWNRHAPNAAANAPPVIAPAPATAPASVTVAQPAPASTAPTPIEQAAALAAAGDALRSSGHLFAPPGANAAEKYLNALALDPANAAAHAGIDALLATQRQRLEPAWQGRQLGAVAALVKSCDALARHASRRGRADWRSQREALARNLGNTIAAAANARDLDTVKTLEPLAATLPAIYPAGFDLAAAKRRALTPIAGSVLRDHGGPLVVYVPATGSAPAYAIGRTAVTRSEYAAFARATGRPAASCREAYNPFSRMRHLTWENPGFAQAGNHPVVCVSWNDAAAYAAWLSTTTGEPYHLVSSAEWQRAAQGMPAGDACRLGNVDDASRRGAVVGERWACNDGAASTAPVGGYAPSALGVYGLYGNVSDWLAGGDARRRPFRGLSWRDGQRQTALGRAGTAGADVGYTNVGFRVVRSIDAAHPAPPSVQLH